jgi:hypothetical protein
MIYRRSTSSLIWHCCTNCSNWPKADYVEKTAPPQSKLCNECDGKQAYGLCKPIEAGAGAKPAVAAAPARSRKK